MTRHHPDLMTTKDIAEQLGLSHCTVRDRIVKRPDFPEPVQVINQKCRWWKKEDVALYIRKKTADYNRKRRSNGAKIL